MAVLARTLKRYNGTAWDTIHPIIPTTALTGTILNAQIDSMEATKLTGMIDKARLPAIAITERIQATTFASYLGGYNDTSGNMEGDILICSTDKKTYIHNGGTAGTTADWSVLETPTDLVESVFGQAGVVSTAEAKAALGYGNSSLVPALGDAGKFLAHDGTWQTPAYIANTWRDEYILPTMTKTVKGGAKLFSNTEQSVAANAVSATASRTYGLQLNAAGELVVNVPWDGGAQRGIDDTPVDGQTAESITSNWAYDHSVPAAAAERHTRVFYVATDPSSGMIEGDLAFIG